MHVAGAEPGDLEIGAVRLGQNVTAQSRRFVYDGWNLLLLWMENNSPVQSFVWGLDLSGSGRVRVV